jgi:hypothetical protein
MSDSYRIITHGIWHIWIKSRKELQISIKNMHLSMSPEEIKTEIEN